MNLVLPQRLNSNVFCNTHSCARCHIWYLFSYSTNTFLTQQYKEPISVSYILYNFWCGILGVCRTSCMAAAQRENYYGHPEVRNKRKLRWEMMDKPGNVACYPNSPLHKRWMLPTVLLWLETGACRAVRELMTQARKQFSVHSLKKKKKKKELYFWITLIYFQIKFDISSMWGK